MKSCLNKRNILSTVLFYAVIGFLAVWLLLRFSSSTSPASMYCLGSDSAFFRYVGKAMQEGLLPYRDFFDMKGPYLFLIEYICQWIREGRISIFAFQCVNLFVSLVFVVKSLELFVENRLIRLLLVFPFLAQLALCLDFGNLTEEYSLVPITFSLYCALKYFKRCDGGEHIHKPAVAVGYGFAFGVVSLIRITNAALICAAVFSVLCVLLAKKEYRNILRNALAFIAGLAAACLPMLVFYATRGLLGEMLYQVFLFGFSYATEHSMLGNLWEAFHLPFARISLIVFLFPILAAVLNRKISWYYRLLAVSGSLATAFVCCMGSPFCHYFVLAAPLLVVGEVLLADLLLREKRGVRGIHCALLCAAAVLIFADGVKESFYESQYVRYYEYFAPVLAEEEIIANNIPEDERESVLTYNLNPAWYIVSDIKPYSRYVAWQNHYIELSPRVEADFVRRLEEDPPLWIVTDKNDAISSEYLRSMIAEQYELESLGEYHYVYRRKDAGSLSSRAEIENG